MSKSLKTIVIKIIAFILLPTLILGRIYDEKWVYLNLNIPVFLSLLNLSTIFILTFIFKKTKVNLDKVEFYFLLFSFFLLTSSSTNFLFYGLNTYQNYTVNKFLNFYFLILPNVVFFFWEKSIKIGLNLIFSLYIFSFILCCILFKEAIVSIITFNRLEALGGGPIVISRFAGISIVFFIFYKNIPLFVKFIGFFIATVVVIACQSKGPITSLLIVILIGFFLKQIINRANIKLYLIIFICTIFSVNYIIEYLVNEGYLVGRLFVYWGDTQIDDESSNERIQMLQSTFSVIFNNPFGIGMGNWSLFINNYGYTLPLGDGPYPHNLFFEIISENGIICLTSLIIYLFLIFKKIRLVILDTISGNIIKNTLFVLILSFIYYFINVFFSGDLSESRFLFVFSAILNQNINYYARTVNKKSN